MTAVAIPYDVLDDVLVYLDKRVLLSVCLVNKLLNIAASRVLYGRDITLNPWTSTWSISPKYESMIRTVIWKEDPSRWYYSYSSLRTRLSQTYLSQTHLLQTPFPDLPRLRAFRWFGTSTNNGGLWVNLFLELTRIESLQEITLPAGPWNKISTSGEWKEALDRSRVVQLGGLPLHFLDWLSPRVLQRLTSIKEPILPLHDVQRILLVPCLSELVLKLLHGMGNYTNILQPIGKLRNLQTLHLTLYYYTSGGEIIIFDASLPHLRHFSLVVGRLSRVSTKNAAYIVKTLTVDAALETMDLHCDFKGWDTPTIYRAIKRHSKTLRVLSAPGWYAHTAMLQALDGFTVLGEVTVGRIEHLEVCILRDFKRIQKVYLYNHQHALPLPTSEIKVLLLQGESTIHTFGESAYTSETGRFINVWRVHWTYDSMLEGPRRNVVQGRYEAIEGMIIA